jgi:predicted phosphodiesterase
MENLIGRHPFSIDNARVTRRGFLLTGGSLVLSGSHAAECPTRTADTAAELRIGLVADLHFADKPAAGSRYYRETPAKLAEAAARLAEERIDFLVALGDLIDSAGTPAAERRNLELIRKQLADIGEKQHFVLGNHCVDQLRKNEFLSVVGQHQSSYSFDRNGIHFVILDACFRADGESYGRRNFNWTDANIPRSQVEWLEADLAAAGTPTIVFAHQRLDEAKSHSVRNAAEVRKALEHSGRVLAVFQGHSHRNELQEIGAIHYCTLAAMVEGSGPEANAYGLLRIPGDGTIRVQGFRQQAGYDWPA